MTPFVKSYGAPSAATFHVRVSVPALFETVSVRMPLAAAMLALFPLAVLLASDQEAVGAGSPEKLAESETSSPTVRMIVPPGATPFAVAALMLGATGCGVGSGSGSGDGGGGGGGGGGGATSAAACANSTELVPEPPRSVSPANVIFHAMARVAVFAGTENCISAHLRLASMDWLRSTSNVEYSTPSLCATACTVRETLTLDHTSTRMFMSRPEAGALV